jgi:hypothetical protein
MRGAGGSVMRGDVDLDAGVRSASDRADGDAFCALIRCADWRARRGAAGDGARGPARARAARRLAERSGGGRGGEQPRLAGCGGRGRRLGRVVTMSKAQCSTRRSARPHEDRPGLAGGHDGPAGCRGHGRWCSAEGPRRCRIAMSGMRRAVPSPARRGCRRVFVCDVSVVTILQALEGLWPEGTVVGVADASAAGPSAETSAASTEFCGDHWSSSFGCVCICGRPTSAWISRSDSSIEGPMSARDDSSSRASIVRIRSGRSPSC